MKTITWCVTALLAGLLVGCSLPEWGPSLPEPRPWGAGLPTYRPSETALRSGDAGQPTMPNEPTGALSLRQAMALALLRSPQLGSFAWGVRQAEAEQLQAALVPNPELETEFENFGGSGAVRGTDAMETTIGISQLIELGGKRAKRMRLAEAGSRVAGWDYEAKRLEVLTSVAQRFIDVLAVQERLDLARENLRLAEATLDSVRKRVTAGSAAPPQQDKALVEAANAAIRVRRLEKELAAARQRLASSWGGTEARFQAAAGNLGELEALPPLDSLTGLLQQNPRIARWANELDQRRAAVDLAKANAIPDVTVGVGVRNFQETNDNAAVAAVSIPLPLFNRNQGEIAKARFGVLKARMDEEAAKAEVRAELEEAYQRMAAAYQEAASLRDTVLPAAKRSYEAFENSYTQGKAEYLDVLDAQRTLIEARIQHMDSLAEYHKAAAEVEGLIGQSLRGEGAAVTEPEEGIHEE